MNQEIDRYNRPRVGVVQLILDVGYALYRRFRDMIGALFFNSENNEDGAGDVASDDDTQDGNWVSRVALSIYSAFRREQPESVCDEDQQSTQSTELCPSHVVTAGSTVPTGSELFERESDIEFYYPNPSFTVEDPSSSESEVTVVHKSASENML